MAQKIVVLMTSIWSENVSYFGCESKFCYMSRVVMATAAMMLR
jgi:hypothetical protein